MKELSVEEKAKAYDEAIERAKYYYDEGKTLEYANDIVSDIFPELKESENERIRKEIIAFLTYYHTGQGNSVKYDDGWIAWLEKQGEQKPPVPKWKYKKDNTPLLRDSLILNRYGCVAKSPSGAIVSDVWVIGYDELAKLPKEESERQGEQKPAWSEEDGSRMNNLCHFLEEYGNQYYGHLTLQDTISWLKSLKDRYAWKPSDEQIYWLKWVANRMPDTEKANEAEAVLEELLEQLKKLKG